MTISFMAWMHGWIALFLFYAVAMIAVWFLGYAELASLMAMAPFWIGIMFIVVKPCHGPAWNDFWWL